MQTKSRSAISEIERSQHHRAFDDQKTGIFALILILLAVLACCLVMSRVRLFWVDELLEFYADTRPSLKQVLWDQVHAPLSLDAPALHVVLHWMHRVIPSPELASRLPSMFCLLLMGLCAYFVTWRFTGRWSSSIVAALLAIFLLSVEYGAEGRGYAMLAASAAVSVAGYTCAVTVVQRRRLGLATLALGLFVAVVTHFYGGFLILPMLLAEIARTAERRRWDWTVLAVILAAVGLGAIVDYPFTKALAPFRAHYYNSGQRSFILVPYTYAWATSHIKLSWEGRIDQRIWGYTAMVLALALIAASIVRMRRTWRTPDSRVSVEVALSIMALIPFLDFCVAQITRANEPRYSVTSFIGLAVLGAVLCSEFFILERVQLAIAGCLLFAILLDAFYFARYFKRMRPIVTNAQLTATEAAAVDRIRDKHIYVQDLAEYLSAHTYAPIEIRQQLVGFHSLNCELAWTGRDVSSLFAQNFQATTLVPFVTYRNLLRDPQPHLILIYHEPSEEWITLELEAQHAKVTDLGYLLGGILYEVAWPQGASCDDKVAAL